MNRALPPSGAWAQRVIVPSRCLVLFFFLAFSMTRAASSEDTTAPVTPPAAIVKCPSRSGGASDIGLLCYDENGSTGTLQRRLNSTRAANEAADDGYVQTGAPEISAEHDGMAKAGTSHKWQTVLPILGEDAEARGHTLPLAFGVMPGFYHGRRHISVTNSLVTIKRQTIPADGLTDIKVKSRELNWSMRLDAWLFPFLNIYGLIGYTREDADAGVAVTPLNRLRAVLGKRPGDLVDIHMDLTGATYGAGFTLVGGYKKFFASYDSNYTISALRGDLPFDNTLSPDVKALLNSIRVGWRTGLAGHNLACWLGGTYWDTTNTIKGTPRIPVIGKIKFSVREKTKNPWSAHIGTNVAVRESFQLILDMGSNFSGLFAIAPTVMYRF